MQLVFKRVKELFCLEAILYHPSGDKPFYLMTDASKTSLEAFLYQKDDDGQRRLVSMASRSLRGAEVNYNGTRSTCYSVGIGKIPFIHPMGPRKD